MMAYSNMPVSRTKSPSVDGFGFCRLRLAHRFWFAIGIGTFIRFRIAASVSTTIRIVRICIIRIRIVRIRIAIDQHLEWEQIIFRRDVRIHPVMRRAIDRTLEGRIADV